MAARDYGQYSGITQALELVGERWAMLIVRDLLVGPRRYGELAAGLPRIPSNILAARLKELQAAGVIRRVPRSRVIVYELTPYGHELEPVVLALGAWGFKTMGDPRAGKFRLEVDSQAASGAHTFLMVLSTAPQPPVVHLERDGSMVGVDVEGTKALFRTDGGAGGRVNGRALPTKVTPASK